MTKLLILESNPEFAQQLKAYFAEQDGFSVCGVTDDGAEALRLMETCKPDVVLVSLLLKNLDGFTILEKSARGGRGPLFLAMGNFSDDKIVARTIALGARYYFMKPVSAEVVCERIGELLAEEAHLPAKEGRVLRRAGSLDERISSIFISIGIPPHIKGYQYLREGIKMAVEDPSIINNVTKGLYPRIGEKFATSASKVERAIRHAIEVAWNRGRIDAINAIFGVRVYIGTEKPTNSEFIALVADKLILESMA